MADDPAAADDGVMFDPDHPYEMVTPLVLVVVVIVLLGGATSMALGTLATEWLSWVLGT